ncbi:hypothetical protein LCGC14_2838880, partial [marine sediment metagenome]
LTNAVYDRIKAHALTSAYRTFVHVPVEDPTKSVVMPYIVIGNQIGIRSESFTTRDTNAEDNVIQVDVWSRYKGDKEVAEIMDNVCQAILSSGLTITGYDTPYLALLEFTNIVEDSTEPSDIVRHGNIRVRFNMAQS